ncbi:MULTISPECIES: sensor histidine kinase [unclassified Isoptericola]|uniref:sensor histidine kinase n=1 Tax=unclassified Isoptericola TaxID=2623355 RepID=UPI00366226AC
MNTPGEARRSALRSPWFQDAGLAALLLAGTAVVADPAPGTAVVWWAATAVGVAAVVLRRRWPVPAFTAALLAAVARMALGAGPAPADVAVLVTVATVAVLRPRRVSLVALGAGLAVVTAWSLVVASAGGGGGFGAGGETLGAGGAPAPSSWGGPAVLGPLLAASWALGWGVRSRRAYLAELEARARDLERERDQRAALAVAAERARLTREMHDVVAHGLAVIVMQAQGGAAAFERRPADTLAALDAIVATGRASLADMRQALAPDDGRDDRPDDRPDRGPASEPGLADLAGLVDRVRQAGTPVALHVEGAPRPLAAAVDAAAFRILQESLTNVMRHAGPAASAQVLVSYDDGALTLEVSDDGPDRADDRGERDHGGNGLRGMRERAALLGGEVSAGPGPRRGFAVRARLPLDPAVPWAREVAP